MEESSVGKILYRALKYFIFSTEQVSVESLLSSFSFQ